MKPKPAHKPSRPNPPQRVAVTTAEPAPQPSRHLDLLYALGIVLIGLLIYWHSLSGPFMFDDSDLMETRSAVRLNDWYIIFTGPRPLTIFSFALNQHWAGFNAFHFHLVSVSLHLLNALLLWRVVRRICDSPGLAGWLNPWARSLVVLAAPLLFLTTPVHTESVAYISSRSELLKATFYLLAVLVFFQAAKKRWIAALLSAFFYGCAVMSKEDALTLPAALLLVDYFFLAAGDWRQLKKNWAVYGLLGSEMVAGGFIVLQRIIHVPSAGFFLKDVTWKDYLFTQLRMYFLYLRLLLVPFGLNVDYDIQPSRSILDHGSWLALLGIGLLAGGAVYFRQRRVLASFGTLFFFLALAPTSSFYPLLDYAAERRLYLPSVGFFLVALALLLEWWRHRHALGYFLAAMVVVYSMGTYSRSRVWQDGLALWQDTAQKSPRKWRVYTWLGLEYTNRGRFAEATQAYQKALELVPVHTNEQAEILSSLGSTFNNRRMYADAIPYYEAALKITPDISNLWTNLAIAELRLGRPEGWQHFQKAIEVNPLAWEPHFARGNMYLQTGRFDEAIRDYERVLNLVPDNADARNNLRAARALKQEREGSRP